MPVTRRLVVVLCVCAAPSLLGCGGGPTTGPAKLTIPSPSAAEQARNNLDNGPIVTVTPRASAMVRQILAGQQMPDPIYLRLRVVPGSCQGYMHKLDLDPHVSADDRVFESAGLKVVVFKRQAEMFRGARVDYVDADGKKGFKVDNPNFDGDWTKRWLFLLEKEKDVK